MMIPAYSYQALLAEYPEYPGIRLGTSKTDEESFRTEHIAILLLRQPKLPSPNPNPNPTPTPPTLQSPRIGLPP